MKELFLTFNFHNCCDNELKTYLLKLNGILDVNFNYEDNSIYIKYNQNIISLKMLFLEIKTFLNILKVPDLVSFNKVSDNNSSYNIIIKDLCCEYCLMGFIEELLLIDGINQAFSDYNYDIKTNVVITISYEDNIININSILELENKFNT